MKRKILYVSGTRADYELMKGTLKAISKDESLKLQLIVTGMHLLHSRGRSIENIRKDFEITKIIPAQQTGELLTELNRVLNKLKPDIILVLGDRLEALLTATAGVMNNIPVFHLSGGDVSGNRDDSFRHAITKLSHIHMPGTNKSANRIIFMGEESWRVKVVGHIMNKEVLTNGRLNEFMKFKVDKNTIIVLQHPVTTEADKAKEQMTAIMNAVITVANARKCQVVVIYPNDDAGSEEIIRVIRLHEKIPLIHTYKNLPGIIFSSLMKYGGVLIGNSSAGITEAPYYNLPVINVGSRQEGRERADNIWDRPNKARELESALVHIFLYGKRASYNPYDGKDVENNILKILKNTDLGIKLLNKRMTY